MNEAIVSPFGKKLFRLFLLFSLVPAILLALAGYYLVIETSSLPSTETDHYSKELTNYYNDFLFKNIDGCLDDPHLDSNALLTYPDFVFWESSGQTCFGGSGARLSPEVVAAIVQAGENRSHGFVERDKSIYQFSCRELTGGTHLCGGYHHGREYANLLASFQTGYASRTSAEELRPRYIFFLSMIFVVLSIATVGFAYLFSARLSRNLTRPLMDLSNASKEIAAGNFKLAVPLSGTGEIKTLIANFNRMAQQLDKTTARLAQSERVAAWRHVAQRFAHELKNPLQPILISLYQIEKSLKSSSGYEQVIEPLRAISEEIKHLTALADRFSQLAKLPPPRFEKTDLNELLTSIANLYKQQLAAYDFVLRLPSQRIYAKVDATYFREALHNLLQNAMDASEESGRIVVELRLHGDTVDFVVQDHGRGMSEDVMASARMPYFTTKEKGSGLGLAIVEKTVNEMGGQLLLSSQEGYGTTITMSLPRKE